MKKLLNYTFRQGSGHWGRLLTTVILLGVGLIACDQYDVDRTFDGPYFVRFTDTTLTYKESYSKPINIQVHNVGPKLSQPITINYTVSGTARENKDYVIQGEKGRVVIPANASTGNIVVYLVNNANNILESSSLTFTLTSVQPSTLQVGFGQNNIVGKQFKLTIQDDCLLGGFYTGSQKYTTSQGVQTYTVPDVEITSADCKTYTLSNWNLGLLSFDAIKASLNFIDNGDNSLTIPSQTNSELGAGTLAGTGAWNPRDRKISLNLLITVKNSAGRDTTLTFAQTYTPQ